MHSKSRYPEPPEDENRYPLIGVLIAIFLALFTLYMGYVVYSYFNARLHETIAEIYQWLEDHRG